MVSLSAKKVGLMATSSHNDQIQAVLDAVKAGEK